MWQLSVVVLQVRLLYQNCHGVPSLGPFLYFLQTTSISNQENQRKILWFQKLPSLRPKRGFCKRLGLCFQHVTKWTKALGPKRRFCRPLGCWCQVKTTLIYCVALCCVSAQQQRPKAWCLQKMLANSFSRFFNTCHSKYDSNKKISVRLPCVGNRIRYTPVLSYLEGQVVIFWKVTRERTVYHEVIFSVPKNIWSFKQFFLK